MEIPAEINYWLTRRIEQFALDNNEPEYLRTLSTRYGCTKSKLVKSRGPLPLNLDSWFRA